MKRLFAFVWLVTIGTNVAEYYSEATAYHAVVILAGAAYFLFVFRGQLLRLVFSMDYLLVLSILVVPILLMLLSDRSFDRNAYTSRIAIALVFVIASVLALRPELNRTLAIAAFAIVAAGAALNLYELFIQNNVWSAAPGRSAGFYINPNISGEALVGYGLVFLLTRAAKLSIADLMLMSLVVVGVFATFSRAGILAGLVLLTAATLMRSQRKQIPRIVFGGLAISLVAFASASYVFRNLDLSEDATARIFSLIEAGGVGDYREDRGMTALNSLDVAMENPLAGAGVGSISEMQEGPHNMFLAMILEYGIMGLVLYLVIISRLIQIARRADRNLSGPILFFVGWLVIFSFASHNLLGNTATIPLMGFALARAYQIQYSRKTRQVEATRPQKTTPCGF
jgi:O-antigen ligase